MRWSKDKQVIILGATRDPKTLAVLAAAGPGFQKREALTTGGVYNALPGVHLVVVDLDTLVELPEISREQLAQVLAEASVPVTDGASFISNPQAWLDKARIASGSIRALPPRAIAFTGFAGGVGKTTLALALARFFRRHTGLPTAVVEVSPAISGIAALTDGDGRMPHIYEVVTQSKPWPRWDGITLAPMDWRAARLLDREQLRQAWEQIVEGHILTVFDAPAYHPLFPVVQEMATVITVTDGRADSLAAAMYLATESGCEIVVNRAGLMTRLALEKKPAAFLPEVRHPLDSDRLGSHLMRLAYPGWR